ncbi:MerR family transcriptional regulator [Roseateles aquatilis]|jgi:chaperone modulatory protein CbpM|uniref:MerR family transcriptional regulator n=1 Tax=Roseateles aquatilis TaxID=431061 RepID=A0A246J8E5_9BURK|nr:chaperone modulator CbpM [Roseateles aquatilis]MBY0364664.1 MerR family transcriptional regulator [Burkholderiaceae bacterium]OWQ88841.1 MerR family transcriptional regulator [Roseateles aquatilis]
MSDHTTSTQVLDETVELTLIEFCRASQTVEEQVRVWVVEGVLKPRGDQPGEWRFAAAALRRARVARTLAQELEVNTPGIALALDLMDEIESLKSSLRRAGLHA